MVVAIEVLFVLCIVMTMWFVGYVGYRLVTDESNRP